MVVRQWPHGALAWTRLPRGPRFRERVRLVLAPDLSRKTSRAGSKPVCRRRHARRAFLMSGRSCSAERRAFFYVSPMAASA